MSKCSNGNFFLGVLIGAAAGAAAAYFSDRRKREAFSDNFSSSVERARDSIVEGYYEARTAIIATATSSPKRPTICSMRLKTTISLRTRSQS